MIFALAGQASGHRGRHPKRLVNAHPIVKDEIQRQRGNKIVELLRIAVREMREPAHSHTHR
jgi:hypothetical protein